MLIERSVDAVPGLDRATGAFIVQRDNCREALLRLAAEHRRRCAARVIGITGSCGKTTVKEWLGGVLATSMPTVRSPASFNNDIGVPITLFQMDAATRAAAQGLGCACCRAWGGVAYGHVVFCLLFVRVPAHGRACACSRACVGGCAVSYTHLTLPTTPYV